MKSVNKSSVILVLFIVSAAAAFPLPAPDNEKETIRLRLPVRVLTEKNRAVDLKKEDLRLTINDQPREILELIKKTASLSRRQDFPGRNFILSFHTTKVGKQLQKAVSFFISDILTPNDSLVLLTPLRVYNIPVSANKGRMITGIHNRLEKDCASYKKQLNAAKNNLENEIKRMKRLFMGGVDDSAQITSYKMIGTFLKTFPQEFLKFRAHFLFPDLNKYRQVLDFLGSREGQRWWIHFQDGDMYGLTPGIKKITEQIEMYCSQSSLARQAFAGDLGQLQKLLEPGDAFPLKQLSKIFISKYVRSNSILLGNQTTKETGTTADIRSHLGGLLESVSANTGGKTIQSADPEQGIKDITKHRDCYYLLVYPSDGLIQPQKVQVKVTSHSQNRDLKLSYQDHFDENEMRWLVQYFSLDKIRITGVSLKQSGNKRMVKFSIQAVTFNKEKKFGLVRVRIELSDNQGNPLYRTENTLRSSKTTITISVPVPVRYTGSARLCIRGYDLIANRLASWEEQVKLE